MKKILLLIIIFTSFLSLFFSCDDKGTGPPNNNAKLNLTLEDASCTEVWLKLQVDNPALKSDVIIYRDNVEIKKINNIIGNDTIIYDEELLPNKEYTYRAKKIINESESIESEEIKAQTMDTTSHNFTFETYTFGEHSSSVLYDVAIIDENNIWAVGEIYMNDSLGNPDPNAFNCVHWDGKSWQPLRIYYYGACSAVDYPPLKAIWAFSKNDIVITNGGSIGWFDGNKIKLDCGVNPLLNGAINKIWGTSSNDLYVVGNGGSIAHYQNGVWQKIESGTDVDLKDIYGTPDGKNIWVSGYEDFKPTVLLKISNLIVETIFNTRDYLFAFNPDHISGEITSVWTNSNFVYVTTPYSLYRKSIYIDPSIEKALRYGDPLSWLGRRVRGNKINNIFIAGNRGYVNHYNGITFKTYQEPADNNITYYGLDVRSNLSIICGRKFENGISDKAIITLIKK